MPGAEPSGSMHFCVLFADKAPGDMAEMEAAESKDPKQIVISIISILFQPTTVGDPDVQVMNTVQIRDMISEFSGISITQENVYHAMRDMNYRINHVNNKFYWLVKKL